MNIYICYWQQRYSSQGILSPWSSRENVREAVRHWCFMEKNPIKKIKKLFRGTSSKTESNFPADGTMVKLSSGRAKELAKKYADIDDVGERAYQILVDLDMVGKSFA